MLLKGRLRFNMFIFSKTDIEGVYIIEPKVFGDERGYFMETYKKEEFEKNGLFYDFVQDNQSQSKKGVLRGLHFQKRFPQTKLVRVLDGEVYDVAVDLRKGSPTYGKYVSTILSGENKKMFLIPKGFAHGFLVLSDSATFAYKVDDIYHPEDESGFKWNDPDIGVEWPLSSKLILSEKDKGLLSFKEAKIEFDL